MHSLAPKCMWIGQVLFARKANSYTNGSNIQRQQRLSHRHQRNHEFSFGTGDVSVRLVGLHNTLAQFTLALQRLVVLGTRVLTVAIRALPHHDLP